MFLWFLLSVVHCFGYQGHYIVGAIADSFLSNSTKSFVQTIPACRRGRLSSCASWADRIKHKLPWSYPLHFIDNDYDVSSHSCNVNLQRDCPDKVCIVEAIRNYTTRLEQRSPEALLFLIHFLGDIHNPMHNIKQYRGGNDYKCTFDGHQTNLHGVWDYMLLNKWISEHYHQNVQLLIDHIVDKINKGVYDVQEWLECPTDCPLHWSQTVGQLNCDMVWLDLNGDLGLNYYQVHGPILEELLAKAGYRAAQLLNKVMEPHMLQEL